MAASGIVTGRASAGRRNATLPTGPGRAGSTSGRRGALRREEEETEHADHRADREHPGEPPEGHARRSIPFVTEADGADDGHHPEDRDEQEREHPMKQDRSDD